MGIETPAGRNEKRKGNHGLHLSLFIRIRSFISHISFIWFIVDFQRVFMTDSLAGCGKIDTETEAGALCVFSPIG